MKRKLQKKTGRVVSKSAVHTRNLTVERLEERRLLSADLIIPPAPNDGGNVAAIVQQATSNDVAIPFDLNIADNLVDSSNAQSYNANTMTSVQWSCLQKTHETCNDVIWTEGDSELDLELIDFNEESGTAEDGDSASASEREAQLRSGGGGGSVITPHVSGGGIQYGSQWLVYEGERIILSFEGGAVGDVITASVITADGTADSGDYNFISSSATIGGTNSSTEGITIEIDILPDEDFTELDESLVVNLSVTTGSSTISQSRICFIILRKPEFKSDVDHNMTSPVLNNDIYRACVDENSHLGQTLTYWYSPLYIYGGIHDGESRVTYSIYSDESSQTDMNEYFSIDSETGEIRLSNSAAYYIRNTNGRYHCDLTIKAMSNSFSFISGGGPCDIAVVQISISHWTVERNCNPKANAYGNDGVSISTLAYSIGMNVSSYQEWLTINNPEQEIVLFGGLKKRLRDLTPVDMLSSFNAGALLVPNTIYAAYCFNPSIKDRYINGETIGWDSIINGFNILGFYVMEFDNSALINNSYATGLQKKTQFTHDLDTLSNDKKLHGLYIVSHGGSLGFGIMSYNPSLPNNAGWGPSWNIRYVDGEFESNDNNQQPEASWTVAGSLNYRLGAVIIHACHASTNGSVLASSSLDQNSGAIVSVLPGTNFPTYYDWDQLWAYDFMAFDGNTHGGKQCTRRW